MTQPGGSAYWTRLHSSAKSGPLHQGALHNHRMYPSKNGNVLLLKTLADQTQCVVPVRTVPCIYFSLFFLFFFVGGAHSPL